ncbi:MAG TPA: hypothetical protein PKA39_04995 [Ignavibacteria bacterium]|nr:hypothetical protein [Ignavibacteria bacterium]
MHNIFFAILMFAAIVCGGKNETSLDKEKKEIQKEIKSPDNKDVQNRNDSGITSNGLKSNQVILPMPSSVLWACGKNSKAYDPREDDIKAAEDILRACFTKEASGTYNPFFGRKLENYHRQFAGAVLENGDKVIWINCFCYAYIDYMRNWKESFILVDDGGNCFFNVKVNLNTGQYYDLMVNGNA